MKINYDSSRGSALVRSIVLIAVSIVIFLVVVLSYRSGAAQARDQRRLSDVKQIAGALKLFYDYNLKYPPSVENQPKDITKYLEFWPQAPNADGDCSREQNVYTYRQTDNGDSYVLGFCLGKSSSGFSAGYHEYKP